MPGLSNLPSQQRNTCVRRLNMELNEKAQYGTHFFMLGPLRLYYIGIRHLRGIVSQSRRLNNFVKKQSSVLVQVVESL